MTYFIGSLISGKYAQLSLKAQQIDGKISETEFRKALVTSILTKSVLYKYSEYRLIRLAQLPEFREIITNHTSRWSDESMNDIEKESYTKIKMVCADE